MIRHEFVYSWDGKTHDNEKPVAWWPGSYRVRIVDLDHGKKNVTFIKPLAVIMKNNGKGTSIRHCIHNFALKISKKYGFDLEKALWVEMDDDIRVARVAGRQELQDGPLYRMTWRKALPNEREMLAPFLFDK